MLAIVSFFLGVLATLACRPLARWTHMLNYPNPIVSQHIKATPYLGGLAVAMGAFAGFFMTGSLARIPELTTVITTPRHPPTVFMIIGVLGFLVLGLLDDAVALTPFVKLGLQCVLTVASLRLGQVIDEDVGAWWQLALNTLWIVGIVNAVNFTDVCDGLVSGLCCIALGIVALTGNAHSEWALALAGSTAGFLVFNFPPASIFLGDAGSHFLGFTLAAMTLPGDILGMHHLAPTQLTFGPLLLMVFIFELLFITRMRLAKGLKWWRGSPDHFSLRMQAAGFSKTRTVVIAWTMAAICGSLALVTAKAPSVPLYIGLMTVPALLSGGSWQWLKRHEVPVKNKSQGHQIGCFPG